jgi:diguanylate cyclase (GGDEF)-like protein/PAS domain S-box-containing protein
MTRASAPDQVSARREPAIPAEAFYRRFRLYILLTWNIPPVFGLAFILFIHLLTPAQMLRIMTTPLEPAFILGSMLFAHLYFRRFIRPVRDWLADPSPARAGPALARMRRFPLDFWAVFLGYLLLAPASVMVSAQLYAGFEATAVDWFRIHLVALIVSIIVGLPVFFLILDLLGRALGGAPLARPHVTIKTKVFLIGALVPLLIDTMLVQYFWARTGYFTLETFFMWLMLEVLAVAGSLVFVRSFGQSLAPLQSVIGKGVEAATSGAPEPGAQSTDELGVLADDFQVLLARRREAEAALHREKELAQVTLASIGDGVVTTGTDGRITFLNAVAEYLTGWALVQAQGRPLTEVFNIINELTRKPAVNPVVRCLREGRIVGLANHTLLVRSDGHEFAIEDSAAPIRDANGDIVGVVLVFHDVTRAREMANRLSWQATHDMLSGLHNRMAFEDRLRQLMQTPADSEHDVHVMLYIDLDQFKVVNDIAGHVAGDEMLKQIAALMQQQVRDTDLLARLGGDEFGVILTHCDLARARLVADAIHQALDNVKFQWNERVFRVGASIGVLEFRPGEQDLTELLSAADLACYAAKNAGRRRTHVYVAEDVRTRQHLSEMDWATRITEAVEQDHLVLYGQTIAVLNGAAVGPGLHFEVLVRLRDGDGGLTLPDVFLPAAERFDLMPVVDRWVITRTFSQVADCLRHNGPQAIAQCAINLSGATLGDESVLPFIKNQLSLHNLPAGLFCFEITETAAISNFPAAMHFIHELRTLGCRFALDDFGSGMSSFSYLRNMAVDYLKIDGQFVRGIAEDAVSRTLVGNINDIGHLLGKHTIAEYAEDAATLDTLRTLGVDFVQGHAVSQPVPLDDLFRACTR